MSSPSPCAGCGPPSHQSEQFHQHHASSSSPSDAAAAAALAGAGAERGYAETAKNLVSSPLVPPPPSSLAKEASAALPPGYGSLYSSYYASCLTLYPPGRGVCAREERLRALDAVGAQSSARAARKDARPFAAASPSLKGGENTSPVLSPSWMIPTNKQQAT